MPIPDFTALSEIQIHCIREVGNAKCHAVTRVCPWNATAQAFIDALDAAARSAIDSVNRQQAGLKDRNWKDPDPLEFMGRELEKGELTELAGLIQDFAHYQRDPQPMKNGRRLAYIRRVHCINPDDWERPPLYIPTPHGVRMFMRQTQQENSAGWLQSFLYDWEGPGEDGYEAFLKANLR